MMHLKTLNQIDLKHSNFKPNRLTPSNFDFKLKDQVHRVVTKSEPALIVLDDAPSLGWLVKTG